MNFAALKNINAAAGGKLALFAVAMFGFGYAMVPLYYKICEVTGVNNLLNPQISETAAAAPNRAVRLEFDVNARGLVSMEPSVRLMKEARPGETYSVIYTLKNLSGEALTAQAVPSYGPARAGKWFKKIQCFCFGKLEMAAGETRQEPVVFVVDSALPEDIATIALSYTFFAIDGAAPPEHGAHGG